MSDTADNRSEMPGGPGADLDHTAHLATRRRTVGRRRQLLLVGITAIGLAGLGAAGCTTANGSSAGVPSCPPNSTKLTVHGTGVATGTPDTLTVDITVSTTGATARDSLAANNTATAAVTAAFATGGVTRQNIQTTGLSVQPNYSFKNGTEVLTGYGVNNTVTAMITDLASAGSVIDAVSGAAGDAGQINSTTFSIKDPRDLEDRARTDAVHQAVSHAQTMAAAAGERLGPVCSLTDTTPVSAAGPALNNEGGSPAISSAVPLEAGSQQASAQVTIVYSLNAGSPTS